MIEAMSIFERKGYDPQLRVLIDYVPHPQDMEYIVMTFPGKRTIYRSLATNDLVLYGIYNASDPQDHLLTRIKDVDGNHHEFRGVWKSRESVMNKYFTDVPHIHRVQMTISRKHYNGGYFSTSYAMEIPTLNKAMKEFELGWLYAPDYFEYAPDEPNYELKKI